MIDLEKLLSGRHIKGSQEILETYHYYSNVVELRGNKLFTYICVDERHFGRGNAFARFRSDMSRIGARYEHLPKGEYFWIFAYFGETLQEIQDFLVGASDAYEKRNDGLPQYKWSHESVFPLMNPVFSLFVCAKIAQPVTMTMKEYMTIHKNRFLWEDRLRHIHQECVENRY